MRILTSAALVTMLLVGYFPSDVTLVAAPQLDQTDQTQEFLPIDELPPQDQLPAAPLLIAAYMFVLVGLFLYVLSVAKRLGGVSKEVRRLEDELSRRGQRG